MTVPDERTQLAHRLTERAHLIPNEGYRHDVVKAAALVQPPTGPLAVHSLEATADPANPGKVILAGNHGGTQVRWELHYADAILLSGALWVAAFKSEADIMAQGADPLTVTP